MFRQKQPVLKLAALALALVSLSGCQLDSFPSESPAQPTESDPYFSSSEEALQAGIDGYSSYLSMSDEITASGGLDPQRIAPYVSDELLSSFLEGYESLLAKGLRSEGATTFDSARLQSWKAGGSNDAYVSFYLCIDVARVRLINSTGQDVTPSDRALRLPILVTMRVSDSIDNAVLTGNEPWSGESFC